MKHNYTLTVLSHNREIAWDTEHPQTAHNWFRVTVETWRTIDTGARVNSVLLCRDGVEIKKASIGILSEESE